MRILIVLCAGIGLMLAAAPAAAQDRVAIDSIGDVRAILGSQGKSICVSGAGEAIAVIYGAPSGAVQNPMIVKIAYSLDGGQTWIRHGPFSAPLQRLYNDIAGTPDFHTNPGELWFAWQTNTSGINVMIEENIPSVPSFSVPIAPPSCAYMWQPSISVAQDDPHDIVATAYSYLIGGNEWAYCWMSPDGGYTWSDTIPMALISPDGAPGAVAAGTNGYVFYAYLDIYTYSPTDSTSYPYYMESTDGGNTWSAETPITVFPVNASSQYWWHEFDCIVVDNEPWVVYHDIGVGGTGGPHVAKATGSPGGWTWTVWDGGVIGRDSTWLYDTLYYCRPDQYPQLSLDPASGRILVSYKSYIYIGDGATWATHAGAHVQGIYTPDGGNTWRITGPLSAANAGEILWDDWSATETADRSVEAGWNSKSYSIWVQEDAQTGAGVLNFESGLFGWWLYDWPVAIEEILDDRVVGCGLTIEPSVTRGACRARFTLREAGDVSLRVYDATGRLVREIIDARFESGIHDVNVETKDLSNGTYFVIIDSDRGSPVAKFCVVR